MEPCSDFLYARPSLIEGWARIWDFGNTLSEYNGSPSGDIADEIASHMDWNMIGYYLRYGMKCYVKEIKKESNKVTIHPK